MPPRASGLTQIVLNCLGFDALQIRSFEELTNDDILQGVAIVARFRSIRRSELVIKKERTEVGVGLDGTLRTPKFGRCRYPYRFKCSPLLKSYSG
jgi:hypothetical protein